MFINSNNTIVYTCSIGQTEGLNAQPQIKNSNLRHVCLTDNNNLTSDEWEIININSLFPMDQYRSQRNLKIRPQLVFPDYKYSLYLDNTVVLKTTVEEFINQLLLGLIKEENEPFFILPFHSFRENLISEFYECFMNNLDTHLNFYEQLRDYIKINSIALKNKPYWTAILFRNHMHSKLIEFSEIWFSNVMRYSRRDQLSIIHSGLQSKLNFVGFELDNHSSKYHNWPILKKERRFRIVDNEQFKISSDFLSQIVKKLSLEDNQIKKINFEEEIFKNYSDDGLKNQILKSENEILKIENENLKKYLNSINNSKIWKFILLIRKLKDYLKKNLNSFNNFKMWSFLLLIRKLKDYLKKKKDLYLKPLLIFYLKLNIYLKFKDQILKIIIKIYTTFKKEEVDIVIPIHNANDYVDKCLKSIFSSKTNFFINLIIVDDFSDLETKKTLKKYSSTKKIKVKIISNKKNIGYTKSVNKGIKISKSKYVVIANSDILVVDFWLDRLIRGVLSKKRVGIVGPLSNAASFQSVPKVYDKYGGLCCNEIPNRMNHKQFDKFIENNSLNINPRIDIINGFCHLITRNLINEIGFLDEINFQRGYCEEVDFSLRALDKNFKILVIDNLYIYHHKTKSFDAEERQNLIRKNFDNLYKKHKKEYVDKLISKMSKNIFLNIIRYNINKIWRYK